MNRLIFAAVCAVFVAWLFALSRDKKARTSKALWIAALWLGIGASRNLSEWLHLSQPGGADRYLEGSPVDRAFLFGLLSMGIVVLLGRSRRVSKMLRANAAILAYFGYCCVSIVWSDFPDVSAKRWIRSLGDIIMVLLVLTDDDWLAALKRLFARVGFVLVPVSILFIRYFPEYGRSYSRSGAPAWTGVTTDKNALGMVCLIFGLAFIWNFLQTWRDPRGKRRSRSLTAYGTLTIMSVWLIQQSNSATALACLLLAGGIMVLTSLSARARKPASVHVLVGGALSIVACAMFLNTGTGLVQTLGRDSTFTGRTAIWSAAIPLIPNSILGSGFESFWLGSRLQKVEDLIHQDVNEAHNGYIEVYLNLGWVGVAVLTAVMIAGYSNIVSSVRRQADASNLMLAYFIAAAMYNVSEAGFKMMHPIWIAFLFAITVLPKSLLREPSPRSVAVPRIGAAPPWDAYQVVEMIGHKST